MAINTENLTLQNIIESAAETENTPELAFFWKNKYIEITQNNLFQLHSETFQLMSLDVVDKPTTTLGDLVILNHLDENGLLDEQKIQATVEIAIRFLDAILQCIPFSKGAYHIVESYRKIGIGFFDIEQYFLKSNIGSQMEKVDTIGQLVSSASYRASEMLALEKGTCRNWKLIEQHLRPKVFEIWENETSKDRRNGLEMSEQFNQESIKNSGYFILPRRNSNLLMFPADVEWQIWSDRDQTAPLTPIEPLKEEVNTPPVQQVFQPLLSEAVNQIKSENSNQNANLNQSINQTGLNQDLDKNLTQTTTTEAFPQNLVQNLFQKQPEDLTKTVTQNPENQPQYQIGELVVVQTQAVPEFEKVYQVIDIHKNQEGITYELTGGDALLEQKRWSENELKPVELTEILHKVNAEEPLVDDSLINKPLLNQVLDLNVLAHPVIFNENQDALLVQKHGEKIDLPGFRVSKNQIPERTILLGMREQFGVETSIIQDIGSSVSHTNLQQDPGSLHLGFLATANYTTHPDLGWFLIENRDVLPMYMQTLIHKIQKIKQNEKLKIELEIAKKEIQNLKTLQNQKPVIYSSIDRKDFEKPSLESNLQFSENEEKKSTNPVIYTSNFHIIQSMSKYALKLEQLVQTNIFGNVNVALQYDDEGAKVVTAQGDDINPDLQQQLDVVLGLVNFCLAKKIAPSEIATILEKDPKGSKVSLNDLVKVIAASLKQAPENADKINGGMLGHIAAEAVLDVMEAVKSGKPVSPSANSSSENKPEVKESPKDSLKDLSNQSNGQAQPQPSQPSNLQNNQPSGQPQMRPQQPAFQEQPKPAEQAHEDNKPMFNNPFARK